MTKDERTDGRKSSGLILDYWSLSHIHEVQSIIAALIWVFSKPGLTPQPPPLPPMNFGTFGALPCRVIIFFYNFRALLCHISSQIKGKSLPPHPFLPKITKLLGHKKCPKTFGLARNPPPLLMKIPKLKRHFFYGASLILQCSIKSPMVVVQSSIAVLK